MFALDDSLRTLPKADLYAEMHRQARGLLDGERDPIANAANLASLLYWTLPDLNWAGFYFLKQPDLLVLGPFHGKPACVRIPVGRGVCGTAVATGAVQIVPDVHAFPGHIACDAASRSELVLPLIAADRMLGVLDLDSPIPNRFDQADAEGCAALMALLLNGSDWA
ncbi:histidine kinase [Elstera cyanobacteriorum]|uniref:GAF domain-containing protein n=1 Tax=Elstera cyanobacteriorum TaxID=2022747 RepID=A0A255XRF9_9PROT|nr:GAF domain-containing protein [Elstera cyanobacteriorum]GFZ92318.1 histidine kinase [Elstera cyanobacteriorum]